MPKNMHSFDSASSNVPAFLVKLWKLVEDPTCDDLIAWSDNGQSFNIKDHVRFAKELLPQYFKHNNMASFIRQLNMYGFKKVVNYEKSGLKNDNDELEFQHVFFLKGRGDLLEFIKRKIPNSKVVEAPPKSNAKDILGDLSSIREKQENMDVLLTKMKKENELLWRELTTMRQKHKTQEQIIQRVIQFLVTIVQRSGNQNLGVGVGVQRKIARMLHDSPTSKASSSQVSNAIDVLRKNNNECVIVPEQIVSPLGPVIHEVTDVDHEEIHSPFTPTIPIVKSPSSVASASEPEKDKVHSKSPMISIINSPKNLAIEPQSILEPLQPKTPARSKPSNPVEFILGLPVDYITENTQDSNNISVLGDGTVSNVISLPEGHEVIGNVISIPEESVISDIIPLVNVCNATSEAEKESSELCDDPPVVLTGNEFFADPDFSTLNSLRRSTSDSNSSLGLLCDTVSKNDFDDTLLSESLQTPKIPEISTDDEMCGLPNLKTYKRKASDEIANVSQSEHNYQLSTTADASTSLVKNVLSNHLLSVDEKLGFTQDRLATTPWNLDLNQLLGLFNSEEGVCDDSLVSNLPDYINIKCEPSDDVIGNEIVQFNPNILDADIANSPLFEALSRDAEVPSGDFVYSEEALFADVLKGTTVDGLESLEEEIPNLPLPTDTSKPQRKRRKLK